MLFRIEKALTINCLNCKCTLPGLMINNTTILFCCTLKVTTCVHLPSAFSNSSRAELGPTGWYSFVTTSPPLYLFLFWKWEITSNFKLSAFSGMLSMKYKMEGVPLGGVLTGPSSCCRESIFQGNHLVISANSRDARVMMNFTFDFRADFLVIFRLL